MLSATKKEFSMKQKTNKQTKKITVHINIKVHGKENRKTIE